MKHSGIKNTGKRSLTGSNKRSDIATSWQAIPTQTQSDLAFPGKRAGKRSLTGSEANTYHQPLAFDEKQVNNGKRGRAGHFITAAEAVMPDKVRYSDSDNANLAKARIRKMREGDRAATEWLGAYHIVYENPQDRVFRKGKWVTIKELNRPLKTALAAKPKKRKPKRDSGACVPDSGNHTSRKRKMQAIHF